MKLQNIIALVTLLLSTGIQNSQASVPTACACTALVTGTLTLAGALKMYMTECKQQNTPASVYGFLAFKQKLKGKMTDTQTRSDLSRTEQFLGFGTAATTLLTTAAVGGCVYNYIFPEAVVTDQKEKTLKKETRSELAREQLILKNKIYDALILNDKKRKMAQDLEAQHKSEAHASVQQLVEEMLTAATSTEPNPIRTTTQTVEPQSTIPTETILAPEITAVLTTLEPTENDLKTQEEFYANKLSELRKLAKTYISEKEINALAKAFELISKKQAEILEKLEIEQKRANATIQMKQLQLARNLSAYEQAIQNLAEAQAENRSKEEISRLETIVESGKRKLTKAKSNSFGDKAKNLWSSFTQIIIP